MILELSQELVKFLDGSTNTFAFAFSALIASFLGGVLASISPCSLGVLPLIIGYIGGYGDSNKLKTFIQLLSFVFGLGVVLSVIGVICALTGAVFSSVGGAYWVLFLASLILVLGLNLLGLVELNLNPIVKRMPKNNGASFFLYPFLVGVLFAFASSPCSTPILAGIMGFAALSKNIALAALMLLLFSLGQGVIIILAGVFTSFLKGLRNFVAVSEVLMKLSGVLLILAAIVVYIKVFVRFF